MVCETLPDKNSLNSLPYTSYDYSYVSIDESMSFPQSSGN